MKKTLFLIFLLCGKMAFAQNMPNDIPKIENWDIVTKFHYEVKNQVIIGKEKITATSYLGFLTLYKNPLNQEEFVLQIIKYPAFTVAQPFVKIYDISVTENKNIVNNFNQKTRENEFQKRLALVDPIIFIKWSETKNLGNQQKILSGPIENWILNQNGEWIKKEGNSELKTELLSEPNPNNIGNILLVGIKFSINGNYHILRIDQKDLTFEARGAK